MSDIPPQLSPSIVNEHAAGLRALVRRLVLDDSRVEDVLQETWLTALRSPPRNQAAFGAWLRKVAVRLAGRSRRAEATRTRHERGVEAEDDVVPPDGIVQREMARRQVVDAVLALPEPYRSTVLYRFFENLESREIAERLDLPLETVRTRLKRGLARLRDKLDHQYDGEPSQWHKALLPLAVLPAAQAAAGVAAGGIGAWSVATWLLGLSALGGSIFGGYRWLQADGSVPAGASSVSAAVEFTPDQLELVPERQTEIAVVDYDFMNRDFASAAEARLALAAEPQPLVEVSGRVVDDRGQPLADADVRLYVHSLRAFDRRFGGGGSRLHRVTQNLTTGADGRFLFRGPIREAAMLQVLVVGPDGQAPVAKVERFTGHNSRVSMPIVRALPGSVATGTVVDRSGRPIAGAKVRYRSRRRSWFDSSALLERGVAGAVTDTNGRFELRGVPTSSFVLAVSAADYAPRFSQAFVAESGKPIDCETLMLEAGHRIRGQVRGLDGRSLAGASIVGLPRKDKASRRGRSMPEVQRAVASRDGTFDLGAFARGEVHVRIEHPEYQAFERTVSLDESSQPLNVDLLPTLTVRIRAIDRETGEVLTAFGVRPIPEERHGRGRRGGGGPRGGPDAAKRGLPPVGPAPAIQAHADGEAEVGGLSALGYRFDVVAPGYSRGLSPAVDLRPGVTPEPIEVKLVRGTTLRGRLRSRPTAGGSPQAVGRALVELMRVEPAGARPTPGRPSSRPGRSGTRKPGPRRDSRRGRFGRGPFGSHPREPLVGIVEAAPDGAFELPAVPPGAYRLRVVATGYLEHERTVELGREDLELAVSLDPGARVAGRILNGDPALWSLRLWRVDQAPAAAGRRGPPSIVRSSAATVDPDTGLFSFAGLRPGSYRMLAWPKGIDAGLATLLVKTSSHSASGAVDLQLAAGDRRLFDVDVERFAPCRVEGSVVCNGRPAAGYSVRLAKAHSARFPVDSEGRFEIPALLAGEYQLEIVRGGGSRADVLSAQSIAVPRTGRIEPRVEFELGTVVVEVDSALASTDAVVVLTDLQSGHRRRRVRLSHDTATFAELPPTRYRMQLFAGQPPDTQRPNSPGGPEVRPIASRIVTVHNAVPVVVRFEPKTTTSETSAAGAGGSPEKRK